MADIKIRPFKHTDVEAFIRLTQSSFAEEWLASGMTLDDFARQTRRIFRWKMIPYRLMTALMGIQWEAFVAEKDNVVVGGGMYIGRRNRMVLTNLMVEPEHRRQGIGQALLVKRLERLAERKVPFVTVEVLETNQASLGNLRKQGFEEYFRRSVYERSLPLSNIRTLPAVESRPVQPGDKVLFRRIEQSIMDPLHRYSEAAETVYFPSFWRKLYTRYTGGKRWARAFTVHGRTVGFLSASFHTLQTKGQISQPLLAENCLPELDAMLLEAGAWLGSEGMESVELECLDNLPEIQKHLLDAGWSKRYTWIGLVKWLDEGARQKVFR